jgi:hypothetical protein
LDGHQCEARLRNSTVVTAVLNCEGSDPIDILYPGSDGGCPPTGIVNGTTDGRIFHVEFDGPCVPLTVHVNSSAPPQLRRVDQEYKGDLAGKQVAVAKGKDVTGDETIFYCYLEDDYIVLKSIADGFSSYISTDDIRDGACQTFTRVRSIATYATHPGRIGLVVDCVSANTDLRFLVFYDKYDLEEVVHTDVVSETRGVVRASGDGAVLSVLFDENVEVYDVRNMMQTPVKRRYSCVNFLRHGNSTVLTFSRVGSNMKQIDASVFMSTAGAEGEVEIPHSMVYEEYPCPDVRIVADDQLIFPTYDPLTLQQDLRHITIGSNNTAIAISRVSSSPPVILFSDLQVIPDVTTTGGPETGAPTTPSVLTTQHSASTEPVTGSTSTTPLPPWAIGAIAVFAVALTAVIIALPITILLWWRKWRTTTKAMQEVSKEEAELDPPQQESTPDPPIPISDNASIHSSRK